MKKLDNIRTSQSMRNSKSEMKKNKKIKSRRRSSPAFRAFVVSLKVFVGLMFAVILALAIWIYNQVDFTFGDDFTAFDLRLSSTIYCLEDGEYVEYEQFKSSDKRVWVDIENIPQDLKDAFVAIEDQRFYSHNGVDIKRTMGAVINVFVKGDSSYGGSTITQQLVKNITNDNERTGERKIREITRALVLETKMSKEKILEMYMNSIYLSQGVHGVQAASDVYFDKDVSQLTLAECACIAGITQYPTTYDPFINPGNNKKKQLTVLGKMLELGYITQEEYNQAATETLDFADVDINDPTRAAEETSSYFADYIFEQAKDDLMREFNYTEKFAEDYLCNGGLKIYATVDPKIQSTMEKYYENEENFPRLGGSETPQSAMVIIEPSTGEIKGIVGGRGQKEGMRVLNRASQSKRQPGSSIKPLSVYAPALEEHVVTLNSIIADQPIKIGDWAPKNSNNKFRGTVTISQAVEWSYNIPAINTLKELGVNTSYDYLKNKLHLSSIVDSVTINNKQYSDKNLPSLALGGLTEGVTPLEMTAAYSALANGGVYIEPISYTMIYDRHDKLIYEKKPAKNKAFSEETAFLMQELLKNVTRSGTAAGTTISGIDTCGKTGTTDDNKDKWFMGFTPYYCGGVWFGYDKPNNISTGSNPSVTIWKSIMTEIHEDLDDKSFEIPDGIKMKSICPYTGLPESGYKKVYANSRFFTANCNGKNHKYIGWTTKSDLFMEKTEDKQEDEKPSDDDTQTPSDNTVSPSPEDPPSTQAPSQDNGHSSPPAPPETPNPDQDSSDGPSDIPHI